jgi:hypothetical protein
LGRAAVVSATAVIFLSTAAIVAASAQTAPAGTVAPAATATLIPRGAWKATGQYHANNLVTFHGSSWRAKIASMGERPGSTSPSTAAYWEQFAEGLDPRGAWLASAIYQPGDLVAYQGSTWRAKLTNKNKAPAAGASWEQFADKGAVGPKGPKGSQGPQGPAGSVAAAGDGSVSMPSISFASNSGTGLFSPALGRVALTEFGNILLHDVGNGTAAFGLRALQNNTGNGNTAVGYEALKSNQSGFDNTAVGNEALTSSLTAATSVAIGSHALDNATTGADNIAIGYKALSQGTPGTGNIAVGTTALQGNEGSMNVAIGYGAGTGATGGSNNIFIGNPGGSADNGTIRIGNGGGETFISGIYGTNVGGSEVTVSTNGQLGYVPSSRRYKDDIKPMDGMGGTLMKLRPVTFRYKKRYANGDRSTQYGLIAEEVVGVLPALVVRNAEGRPETVKYRELPALLLAGYQEQQNAIQAQSQRVARQAKVIDSQRADITALAARAKRQAAIITAQAGTIAALDRRLRRIESAVSHARTAALR